MSTNLEIESYDLIPDNTTKQCSPADIRNAIADLYKYGFRYQRGWDRLGDPDSLGDITKSKTSHIWSIAPKTGRMSFDFWCGGNFYQKTASMSLTIDTSATGSYYVLFNADGTLETKEYSLMNQDEFMKCITDLYYYDAVNDIVYWAKDEQHGIVQDPMTHWNNHYNHGFCWPGFGTEFEGFEDASDVFTKITAGTFCDEDIPNFLAEITTMPFGYKIGSDGHWEFSAADNKVGYIESGNSYVSYNKETAGVWSLEVSSYSTDYIIYPIIRTNFIDIPLFQAVGQQFYGSRSDARDALLRHLHAINLSGTPGAEAKVIAAYICKRNGEIEDSGGNVPEAIIDLRGRKLT